MTAAELRGANKPSLNEALGWVGSRVDDIYGAGVGRLEDVWIDPGTGVPRWLLVKEGRFGGRTTLIPFEDATAGAGHVWIPYEREVVRDAPVVQPGAPLTQQLETALRSHYAAAAPHKDQDPTTAATAGAAARRAQRSMPPALDPLDGNGFSEHHSQHPRPPSPQHADVAASHAAVESTPPAAFGAPLHAPASPPQQHTMPPRPSQPPRPPAPQQQPYAYQPAQRAPQAAQQAPSPYAPPVWSPSPTPSPAPPRHDPAPVAPQQLHRSQPPRASQPQPARPQPPQWQSQQPPQPPQPPAPQRPPHLAPAPQQQEQAGEHRPPPGGYQPHPTPPAAPQFPGAPGGDSGSERLTAIPVIHGLDRPYRVELELNGSIKVSGELTGFSLTPSEQDRD